MGSSFWGLHKNLLLALSRGVLVPMPECESACWVQVTSVCACDGFLFSGSDDCTAKQYWVTWSRGVPAGIMDSSTPGLDQLYARLGEVAGSLPLPLML